MPPRAGEGALPSFSPPSYTKPSLWAPLLSLMGPRREAGQTVPLASVQLSHPFCFMSVTVLWTSRFQALGALGAGSLSTLVLMLLVLTGLAEGSAVSCNSSKVWRSCERLCSMAAIWSLMLWMLWVLSMLILFLRACTAEGSWGGCWTMGQTPYSILLVD